GCHGSASVTIQAVPSSLAISITPVQPACGGQKGSVTLNATGGTSPYTFSGAATSNLLAGTYSYTVTDAGGCKSIGSCTIQNAPPLIVITTSKTNVTCFGGKNATANSSASNGFAPYTYLWSNGKTTANVTALAAGTYTVTVTDSHGCSVTASVTITQPTAVTVSMSTSPGRAVATPSGGTPGYTYSWSNGQVTQTATGLTHGQPYTCIVTDSKGCKGTGL